jgi:hypothetical protein
VRPLAAAAALFACLPLAAASERETQRPHNVPPQGYVALFNGQDLEGWKGMPHTDPRQVQAMSEEDREAFFAKNWEEVQQHWRVEDGELVNDGEGPYLTTAKDYRNFELRLEYKTVPLADSGIYLRGTPQVQIWDTTEAGGKQNRGAEKGSGGLFNNQQGGKDPLVHADKPFGEWNHFRIRMVGENVTVWFNDKLTVDNVPLENFWDRSQPVFEEGPIQLQTHGGEIRFRNVFLREIDDEEGFAALFNGKDLSGWTGATEGWQVEDATLICPDDGGGNLFTERDYGDFIFRFDFELQPGGNNGVGIRCERGQDAAYHGMEIQILDNDSPMYADIKPYQAHGSVYGVVPAKRGYLNPPGEWNHEEIKAKDNHITVTLNGTVIVDADLAEAAKDGTIDGREHPGLFNESGAIGFLGHGHRLRFRNLRIKELK